jgi:hypothetical protein
MADPTEHAADGPDVEHRRPQGAPDAAVAAVGKLTEALETVERARGALYDFHQLTGSADLKAGVAAVLLRTAGRPDLADRIDAEIVGRNVLPGRWTFQVVEEYDGGYYARFRAVEREVRDTMLGGRRHVLEAELKEDRRTRGRPGHEARPAADT